MPPRSSPVALLAVAAVLGGCGSSDPTGSTGARSARAAPALAARPPAHGEILVRGAASPLTRGPYVFDGSYVVRFVQYEPSGDPVDFAQETSFVAALERPSTPGTPAARLFRTAAPAGRTTVTLHGRYLVDVSFGDFPFAVRFTPRR